MADKIQTREAKAHEKDVRRKADVFSPSLTRLEGLGARVADGPAVVDPGSVGFGRAGVQLLDLRTDPPGGLLLLMLRQRTSSLLFVVSRVRLQGWKRDSNPLIQLCKFAVTLLFPGHLGVACPLTSASAPPVKGGFRRRRGDREISFAADDLAKVGRLA